MGSKKTNVNVVIASNVALVSPLSRRGHPARQCDPGWSAGSCGRRTCRFGGDQEHEDGGRSAAVLVHVAQLGGPLLAPGGQLDAHRGLVDCGPGAVAHPGLPEPPGHLLGQDGQLLQSQPPIQIALRPGQQESGTQIV